MRVDFLVSCVFALSIAGCSNGYKNYGLEHGLIVGGSMLAANKIAKHIIPSRPKTRKAIVIGVGVLGAGYFYNREKQARKAPFDKWYADSQWDALTPLITAGFLSHAID